MAGVSPAFGGPGSFDQPNYSDTANPYIYNTSFSLRLQVNVL